jgi:predicted membrane channel-forming protein YqfA (hemolysin III family)
MPLKNKIFTALAIVFGALGIYLVLSSDRIQMDPFNIVIFLLAGGVIVYLYLLYFRNR